MIKQNAFHHYFFFWLFFFLITTYVYDRKKINTFFLNRTFVYMQLNYSDKLDRVYLKKNASKFLRTINEFRFKFCGYYLYKLQNANRFVCVLVHTLLPSSNRMSVVALPLTRRKDVSKAIIRQVKMLKKGEKNPHNLTQSFHCI